ncbi:MAG: hypothetical protein LBR30_00230 [Clostridioides sp.]|jgi:hypothetical protein|nr:hypothetical protein [Clostridioides sp.]
MCDITKINIFYFKKVNIFTFNKKNIFDFRKRKRGFIMMECISSMSIFLLCIMLISSVIQASFKYFDKNKINIEIMNVSNEYLQNLKYKVVNEVNFQDSGVENVRGCDVSYFIQKENNFMENYKIILNVKKGQSELEVVSYIAKEESLE